MALPAGFTFSQASLQDYSDCPRRFQLRYALGVRWPAAESEPSEWEKRAQQGAAFHRLVHQHTVGIPAGALTESIADPELLVWWQAYLHTPPPDLPTGLRRSEVRLSAPLGSFRLMARYDMLAIAPGERAVIVDWKTNKLRPKRRLLESRWQTRVYRYLLVEAGTELNQGVALTPEQVELIYWFTNYPQQAERLPYDSSQHQEDGLLLQAAVAEIAARDQEQWTLTDDLKHCRYCTYRTLCERNERASAVDAPEPDWEPQEEPEDWEIDLDQIGEIAF
jgi:CRISPR/Cas system-associated exonuclease Cas4 (RecB family)